MSELLDSLTAERVFSLFVIDLEQASAHGDSAYVLKIVLPKNARFLGILNVPSPLAGLGLQVGSGRDAYAFLCDPSEKEMRNVYITPVRHDMVFPWSALEGRNEDGVEYRRDSPGEDRYPNNPVHCVPLGMTAPSGVPTLHVQTRVAPDKYAQFEQELRDEHYLILDGMAVLQALKAKV